MLTFRCVPPLFKMANNKRFIHDLKIFYFLKFSNYGRFRKIIKKNSLP
jgi:hypothetical protein